MVRSTCMFVAVAICLLAAACGEDAPKPVETELSAPPVARSSARDSSLPSVSPERCAPVLEEFSRLATPNADAVARTNWRLYRVGSCLIRAHGTFSNRASFMDGWAGLPADCNFQSARYRAYGKRFIVDPDEVGTTLAGCGVDGPTGYLDAVTSWGLGDEDHLFLLDRDGHAVFVLRPLGEPGCLVDVPPNAQKIVASGTAGCDTRALDNDLREPPE